MRRSRDSGHERGQVLFIVAFAMLALIAIGAIVVDLGLSWMLRRQEQNAADPAAIAASRYIEEGDNATTRGKMNVAACFYAKRNGFFGADNNSCDTARGAGELQVHWPPVSGDFAGRPQMVQVVISAAHASFFGQFLGRPTATVTTSAVAARETVSANTNSLVALDPDSCGAGKTHGNGVVTIEPVENPDTGDPFNGGFVHVNSTCSPTGTYDNQCGSGSGAFHQGGNAGTKIVAPMIYIQGTCQQSGGTVASPVTEGAPPAPDPMAGLFGPRQQDYPAGHCPRKQGNSIVYDTEAPTGTMAGTCNRSQKDSTVTLTPGVYWGGWSFSGNNVTVKLEPGIYIIAGGGAKISGSATIDSTPAAIGGDPNPSTDPARILIFSTDNTTDPDCANDIALARNGQTGWEARCVQGSGRHDRSGEPAGLGPGLRSVEGPSHLAGPQGEQPNRPNQAGRPGGPEPRRHDLRPSRRRQDHRERERHGYAAGRPDHLVDMGHRRQRQPLYAVRPSGPVPHHAAGPGRLS